jgi:anthranilate/para-aminobenzoate synthase component I
LGFNRRSQFNILIRTALCIGGSLYFQVGAGIVADSRPDSEYDETLAKAAGFVSALESHCEPRTLGETGTLLSAAARPSTPNHKR